MFNLAGTTQTLAPKAAAVIAPARTLTLAPKGTVSKDVKKEISPEVIAVAAEYNDIISRIRVNGKAIGWTQIKAVPGVNGVYLTKVGETRLEFKDGQPVKDQYGNIAKKKDENGNVLEINPISMSILNSSLGALSKGTYQEHKMWLDSMEIFIQIAKEFLRDTNSTTELGKVLTAASDRLPK